MIEEPKTKGGPAQFAQLQRQVRLMVAQLAKADAVAAALQAENVRLREALGIAVNWEKDFCDGEESRHPWLPAARKAMQRPKRTRRKPAGTATGDGA